MNRWKAVLSAGTAVLCLVAAAALYVVPAAPGKAGRHAAAVRSTVLVTAGMPKEFGFKLSKGSVPTGLVTFKVTNRGAIAHNFKICYAVNGGRGNNCVGKATGLITPGRSQSLTVTLRKGVHEYLSTVPGQARLGMKGVFDVGITLPPAGVLGVQSPTIHAAAPALPAPAAAAGGSNGAASAQCTHPVDSSVSVEITDDGFTLSTDSIPCGTVTFNIHSSATGDHTFAVEGAAASPLIHGGDSHGMQAYLQPGTYTYHEPDGEGADHWGGTFSVT
jgi:hypothetical protein